MTKETELFNSINVENIDIKESEELYKYLINKFEKIYKEDISECVPLKRICQVIAKHSNKISVGIEGEYYCKDFVAEYSYFYSKLFQKIDPSCRRIHFWKNWKIVQENYLGYSILRPLNFMAEGKRLGKVGRTFIKYPECDNEYLLLYKAEYKANLKGVCYNIKFRTTPFIQQDTQVGTCAQSTIWMASRYLHGRFRFREYLMDEINEMATKYLATGSILPSSGLIEAQMVECLREMGYIPLLYPIEETDFPDGIIYRYIESGMPVILTVKLLNKDTGKYNYHAIVVIGHNFNPKHMKTIQKSEVATGKFKYYTPLSWINYFLLHDDANGPYLPLFIRQEDANILEKQKDILKIKEDFFIYPCYEKYYDKKEKKEKAILKFKVESILIPLPREINLRGESAEFKAYDLIVNSDIIKVELTKLQSASDSEIKNNPTLQTFVKTRDEKKLVLRTYFRPSNEYKVELGGSGLIEYLRKIYCLLHLPKYIWVVEISTPELFANEAEKDRKMLGEVIFDATAPEVSEAFLVIHLPCLCVIRLPNRGKTTVKNALEQKELKADKAYSHRINK